MKKKKKDNSGEGIKFQFSGPYIIGDINQRTNRIFFFFLILFNNFIDPEFKVIENNTQPDLLYLFFLQNVKITSSVIWFTIDG